MKLPRYNVAITISDPDDPGVKAEFLLKRYERDKLLGMELIGMLVQELERDDGEDEGAER